MGRNDMSGQRSSFAKLAILAKSGIVMLFCIGCDQKASSAKWLNTVTGTYYGDQKGFTEVLDLQTNGTFHHTVTIKLETVVDESGKWNFDDRHTAVLLEEFTTFFDFDSRTVVRKGKKWTEAAYMLMRVGDVCDRISPSVNFEYSLYKR